MRAVQAVFQERPVQAVIEGLAGSTVAVCHVAQVNKACRPIRHIWEQEALAEGELEATNSMWPETIRPFLPSFIEQISEDD